MSRVKATGTSPCTRADAITRLAQAEAHVMVAELVLDGTSQAAIPGVAVANAVLAGIAASDAACCAKLKERPRGQSHAEATKLLATVVPHGAEMARDLERLLKRKDDAHYGLTFLSHADASKLVGYAKRMVELARRVVES
jgi:hypothetical protein